MSMDYQYFYQLCPGLRLTYSADCQKCSLVLEYKIQNSIKELFIPYNPEFKEK